MADKKTELTFIFINPNTPKQTEQHLKKIILEKLQNDHRLKP